MARPGADPDAPLRERLDDAVLADDPIELQDLVLEVALDAAEREWAECSCVQLARHRNAVVRGNALQGLAHLARRFGALDRNRVQRIVERGLHAQHEYVREQAEAAARDIETFLDWRFQHPR